MIAKLLQILKKWFHIHRYNESVRREYSDPKHACRAVTRQLSRRCKCGKEKVVYAEVISTDRLMEQYLNGQIIHLKPRRAIQFIHLKPEKKYNE